MRNHRQKILIFGIALLIFISISSGSADCAEYALSLEDAIQLARNSNFEIQLAEAEADKMRGDAMKANAVFFPQATVSETYIKTNDPLNVFGFKLKQEIVTQSDFNPALLNDPENIENFTTKIEVKQPLINLDGFFGRSAARNGVKAMEHKLERTEHFVIFQLKNVYYGLVLARASLDVINQSIDAAKSGRNQALDYFNEGFINKSEYLQSEVWLLQLESQKAEIENKIIDANNNLKYMLDIGDDRQIMPTDSLLIVSVRDYSYDLEQVNQERSDMLAMRYRVKAMEKTVKMNCFKYMPNFNIFANFEYNDDNVFGSGAENWTAGAMLKWDIFKGFENYGEVKKAKADLHYARIEYRKAALKNKVDVESALSNLNTAMKRVELSDESIKQAEESLRIITDRYAKGLEKTTDLLAAEATLAHSRLDYLKAIYDYNISVFHIELLLERSMVQ
ncbi:MAG: hypothetical protein B6244_00350 [Candidatus Cloacimonetes bacterium 4572_55]|nr:MAG: hypothetical protein B6244_00350 [Candidatus Cloacimonetes bacterium 4572_55]